LHGVREGEEGKAQGEKGAGSSSEGNTNLGSSRRPAADRSKKAESA
jgi:hypothetical protein